MAEAALNGDLLDKIFRLLVRWGHYDVVWGVVPRVCKRWENVRNRDHFKRELYESRYWASPCAAQFFDAVNDFRRLRHSYETTIANLVALIRMHGVPFPYLWIIDNFLRPRGPGGWQDLCIYWSTPIEAVETIKEHLKTMHECCELIKHPPAKAFLDEVSVPHFQVPPSPLLDAFRQMLLAISRATLKAAGVAEHPTDVYLTGPEWCSICCAFDDQTSVITVTTDRNWDKCRNCSRHLYLANQKLSPLGVELFEFPCQVQKNNVPFQVIRETNNGELTFVFEKYGQTFITGAHEVWFPNVEMLCEKICLDLIDPATQDSLTLSDQGLKHVFNNGDLITLDRFSEQVSQVYHDAMLAMEDDSDDENSDEESYDFCQSSDEASGSCSAE